MFVQTYNDSQNSVVHLNDPYLDVVFVLRIVLPLLYLIILVFLVYKFFKMFKKVNQSLERIDKNTDLINQMLQRKEKEGTSVKTD